MTRQLSRRQREVLRLVSEELERSGRGPTLRELGERLGGLSPSSVHQQLDALARKGYLRWPRHRPQEAEVLVPAEVVPASNQWRVWIVGTIAAGAPIDAVEEPEDSVMVDGARMAGGPAGASLFALRVQGDSMVDACIQHGDIVIVRRQDTAEDGDTVVALLEGERATLKRYFREPDRVRLAPANPYYPDIFARDVQVQGKVVGVLRYG